MSKQVAPRLDKILALADSSHDGEALVAVRMARQMLSRDGLSFGDLARAAVQKPQRMSFPRSLFPNQNTVNLESEISALKQEIDELRGGKTVQETQAEVWRLRATELEQKLRQSMAETERWRQLAQETADQLWDLGQALQTENTVSTPTVAKKA
jgi:hypothetical protein